jgi:hypothetical protein
MGQLIDMKVDKIETNTGVDDSIFTKPGSWDGIPLINCKEVKALSVFSY